MKSAYLLVATRLEAGGPMEERHEANIADVLAMLEQTTLGPQLQRLLLRYYELQGRFDLAEDHLFELLEADPSAGALGLEFYRRLEAKSDAQLEAGRLPRDEVEAGKAEVERLQRSRT